MRTDLNICILLPNQQVLCAVPPTMKLSDIHAAMNKKLDQLSPDRERPSSAEEEELMFYLSISG